MILLTTGRWDATIQQQWTPEQIRPTVDTTDVPHRSQVLSTTPGASTMNETTGMYGKIHCTCQPSTQKKYQSQRSVALFAVPRLFTISPNCSGETQSISRANTAIFRTRIRHCQDVLFSPKLRTFADRIPTTFNRTVEGLVPHSLSIEIKRKREKTKHQYFSENQGVEYTNHSHYENRPGGIVCDNLRTISRAL